MTLTKHERLSSACLHTMSASYLCYGVVRRVGGLHALIATDPYSNMSRLNHAHIVGTVAYRQRDSLNVFLHHIHNLRLLQRRHSAETIGRDRQRWLVYVYTAVLGKIKEYCEKERKEEIHFEMAGK